MKNQNTKNNFGNNFQEKNCKNSNKQTLKSVPKESDEQKLFKGINLIEGLINSKKFEIEREESNHSVVILENGKKKMDHSTKQHTDQEGVRNNQDIQDIQDIQDVNDAEIIIKLDDEENNNSNTILNDQNLKSTNFAGTTNAISINQDVSNTTKNKKNDEEFNEIVKKLSGLNQVKQVIVERKKKEETTQVKFKSDYSENTNDRIENNKKLLNFKKEDVDEFGPDSDTNTRTGDVIQLGQDENLKEDYSKRLNYQGKADGTDDPSSLLGSFKKISERYEQQDSSKRIVLKRRPKGIKNEYFYRVKSHQELFQIGMSYYKELLNGNKSLAFITEESFFHQRNSILAIASFIKYQENIKILIVSLGLQNGQYRNVVQKSMEEQTVIGNNDDEMPTFYEHEGITFLDFKEIFSFRRRYDESGYSELIALLTNSFDLILWDTPTLSELKGKKEEYFPILMSFDKISLVIRKAGDSYKRVDDMRVFFSRYGINIKGILFSPNDKGKTK